MMSFADGFARLDSPCMSFVDFCSRIDCGCLVLEVRNDGCNHKSSCNENLG